MRQFFVNGASELIAGYRGKRKGRKVKIRDEEGNITRSIRLHKKKPKGCSTPRRVCIKCLKNVIRKNDKRYESKVCKECQLQSHSPINTIEYGAHEKRRVQTQRD